MVAKIFSNSSVGYILPHTTDCLSVETRSATVCQTIERHTMFGVLVFGSNHSTSFVHVASVDSCHAFILKGAVVLFHAIECVLAQSGNANHGVHVLCRMNLKAVHDSTACIVRKVQFRNVFSSEELIAHRS